MSALADYLRSIADVCDADSSIASVIVVKSGEDEIHMGIADPSSMISHRERMYSLVFAAKQAIDVGVVKSTPAQIAAIADILAS